MSGEHCGCGIGIARSRFIDASNSNRKLPSASRRLVFESNYRDRGRREVIPALCQKSNRRDSWGCAYEVRVYISAE